MEFVLEILDDQKEALAHDLRFEEGEEAKEIQNRLNQVLKAIELIEKMDRRDSGEDAASNWQDIMHEKGITPNHLQ